MEKYYPTPTIQLLSEIAGLLKEILKELKKETKEG